MTRQYVKRRPQAWAGEAIGILTLKTAIPYVPGNVSNATSFDFPVRYRQIEGATIGRLVDQADPNLVEPVIAAAKALRDEGVKAITGACGFLALFQQDVVEALDIPVLLSSLLQLPMIYAITQRPIGILTANDKRLTETHFVACRVDHSIPYVLRGMQDQPEFRSGILEEAGSLDSDILEAEVVQVAEELISDHPEIGAILLECSDLPPYSKAIQAAMSRPVFDYLTLIEWAARAIEPRSF